jgi:hypothetical protein
MDFSKSEGVTAEYFLNNLVEFYTTELTKETLKEDGLRSKTVNQLYKYGMAFTFKTKTDANELSATTIRSLSNSTLLPFSPLMVFILPFQASCR